MPKKKNGGFHCKTEAQKKAIRASYARKAEKEKSGLVPVTIKKHNDRNGGHPHIIMDNIENKHVSVGLSTKPKKGKRGGTNYALEKSPLDDGKTSYMRRQGTVAPKGEYQNKRKGTMTPKDYEQAKVYAERAKQKYLDEKKTKKSSANVQEHCAKHSK